MQEMDTMAWVFWGIGAVIMLAQCLFGYRLQKILIGLVALLGSGAIGYSVTASLGAPTVVCWVVAIIVSGLLAWASFNLYRFGVFMLCLLVCYSVAALFISSPQWLAPVIGLGGGVLLGGLAVAYTRQILIFTTSVGGGFGLVSTILQLVPGLSGGARFAITLICGLAMVVLGILFQLRTTKPTPKEEKAGKKQKAVPASAPVEAAALETTAAETAAAEAANTSDSEQ